MGNPDPVHVGKHFLDAAADLGLAAEIVDSRKTQSKSKWINRFFWHLLDHRPPFQKRFNREFLATVRAFRPTHVLTSGLTPLVADTLDQLGQMGIACLNFSTDDPWNPAHFCRWNQAALPRFTAIFNPRSANHDDFLKAGCRHVVPLPFAYSRSCHYITDEDPFQGAWNPSPNQILFAGAADTDRLEYLQALIAAGFEPLLYGINWSRYSWAKPFHRGILSIEHQRYMVSRVPLCLGLVRRANRDSHSMRTYEIPAMGGCLVTESTPDHHQLFGSSGEATRFFRTPGELVAVCADLFAMANLRRELADAARVRVVSGGNSYTDRLKQILSI